MTNKKTTALYPLVLLLVAGAFQAHAWEANVDDVNSEGGLRGHVVETLATVQAIDQNKRLVTLKSEDSGEVSTIEVDESVKNLKQVKKGDRVRIQYYEALAWNIIKNKDRKEATKTDSQVTATAKPGEKPAGKTARQVHVIAEVREIDKKTPSVTLRGPEGNSETFAVRDPKNLKGLKVGDQVDITYTEAMAVSVEKAPK
jgi:Cu/Ag efflux protein CusF